MVRSSIHRNLRFVQRLRVPIMSPAIAGTALCLAALASSGLGARGLAAQEPESARLRVYVDCAEGCDLEHFQREILFNDWVRDQADADVSILITVQAAGGGGSRYDLMFRGQDRFEGIDETLQYTSGATQTDAEVRDELTLITEIGLLRYVARTSGFRTIDVSFDRESEGLDPTSTQEDPWNRWVFETSISGSMEAEDRSEEYSVGASQSISRVTEGMKFGLELQTDYDESNFTVSDGSIVTSIIRSYEAELLYVGSLGPHWGLGFRGYAGHVPYSNYDLAVRFAPAIEYNIFPYDESTRRQLRLLYDVGLRHQDYLEETVYLEARESRWEESVAIVLELDELWGAADLAIEGSHLLDDFRRNRLTAYGYLQFRLFRGFGIFFEANASRVRDQINLPRGDATDEEILLRQRELQTDFRLEASVGLDFTFGSVFSDAVNARFGS